jgi:hypothetical protein
MGIDSRNMFESITKKIVKYRYIIALIIFIILVIFKINGSSISQWDNYFHDKIDTQKESLLIGKPRAIRSDEWLVQTPMFMAQVYSKDYYPLYNKNIRSNGENMIIPYYAPVFDLTLIGRPFNWGFILLNKEMGFSWYWNMGIILLFLMSFEMISILTKKDDLLSFLGAVWITFSAPIQWWLSTSVVDIIIYSQLLVVSFYYYMENFKNLKRKVIFALVFTISTIGYILTLYPPIQIPLGLLTLIFLVWILFRNLKIKSFHIQKSDIIIAAIAIIITSVVTVKFILDSKDAIELMMNTAYPGKRFILGGGLKLNYLGLYLISMLLPFKDSKLINSSEVSSFINFIPALIICFALLYKRIDKGVRKLSLALMVYLLFCISWTIIRYPNLFAKVTLFSNVPEQRLTLIIGLIGVYLTIIVFKSIIEREKPFNRILSVTVATIASLFNIFAFKDSGMIDYAGRKYAVIVIVLFFLLNAFFVKGYKKLFSFIMIAIILVSGLCVNPIEKGLGAIYNKKISSEIMNIDKRDSGTWMGINNLVYGDFLMGNGVKTINSVNTYPDLKEWKKLDVNGKYVQSYNRYAHIVISLTNNKTEFQSPQSDVFVLHLNIGDIHKLNVKYILSNEDLSKYNANGSNILFDKIYYNSVDNVYIYRFQ